MQVGRPEKPIDWDKVDKFIKSGTKGKDIALQFGMTDETFYKRCLQEKGCYFSTYSTELISAGKAEARWAHWDEGVNKRNTNILTKIYEKIEREDKEKEGVTENVEIVRSADPTMGGRMSPGSEMETGEPVLDSQPSGTEDSMQAELGTASPSEGSTSMHSSPES